MSSSFFGQKKSIDQEQPKTDGSGYQTGGKIDEIVAELVALAHDSDPTAKYGMTKSTRYWKEAT